MVDLNSQVDPSPEPLPPSSNASDLEQRLGLYRVFLKLYEHHRELLDEILDLETSDRHRVRGVWLYVQAMIGEQISITTNLLQGTTQCLLQPQNCWIIGRDRKVGLSIQDKRLSRRHAMLQYVPERGFYLVDLNSTNGTYVNGEPVRRAVLLNDGDRIRLGSLSFLFFVGFQSRTLSTIPPEWLAQGVASPNSANSSEASITVKEPEPTPQELDDTTAGSEKETSMFPNLAAQLETPTHTSGSTDLSTTQKSEILDRFLNR